MSTVWTLRRCPSLVDRALLGWRDVRNQAWEDCCPNKRPARFIEFPDMVARRKEQLLVGKGTPRMREQDFCCYSDDEVRSFALDMRSLFIHDRAGHLAVCTRCQTRLESWTKLLSEFDRQTFARHGRADA